MPDPIEKAKHVLGAAGTGLKALEKIGELAQETLGTRSPLKAMGTLQTILTIVEAIRGGLSGSMSLEDIETELKKLPVSLASNNATADRDLDKKFGGRDALEK